MARNLSSDAVTEFAIHSRLLADTHYLGRLPVSHLLLHKSASVPWFVLVPETGYTDLLDVPDESRDIIMREAAAISDFIKRALGYHKVNLAAIGNVVPQLHLHIVGRSADDACWPAPVWGNLPATREYAAPELDQLRQRLRQFLGSRLSE